MLATKKFRKIFLAIICIFCLTLALPSASAFADERDELYLGGFPAGFILNTQNVEVIGLCEVNTGDGAVCPARDGGIMAGDVIKSVNGITITSANALTNTIKEDFTVYKFSVQRGEEQFDTEITPAKDKNNGKKHFGMLVRDSLNGIGTVTYVDKTNDRFGSLGHPVTDSNGNLIEINGGSLYGCSIYDVKRGLRGNPGELKGIFDNGAVVGTISLNSRCGIFGQIASDYDVSKLKKIKRGSASDATIGKATIFSTLDGNAAQEYEISIIKVDENNKENKNFVIKINDKTLLEKAGGIVQGMSGSPIVQNGKLIGAVTHVFVNDPTRGYGISLANMTNS